MPEKRKWMKSLREKKRWTQKQAAQMCGIALTTYIEIETGKSPGNMKTRAKVARTFHIEMDWFDKPPAVSIEKEHEAAEKKKPKTKPKKQSKTKDYKELVENVMEKESTEFQKMQEKYQIYPCRRSLITVTAEGKITGCYWENLKSLEGNRNHDRRYQNNI